MVQIDESNPFPPSRVSYHHVITKMNSTLVGPNKSNTKTLKRNYLLFVQSFIDGNIYI